MALRSNVCFWYANIGPPCFTLYLLILSFLKIKKDAAAITNAFVMQVISNKKSDHVAAIISLYMYTH